LKDRENGTKKERERESGVYIYIYIHIIILFWIRCEIVCSALVPVGAKSSQWILVPLAFLRPPSTNDPEAQQ